MSSCLINIDINDYEIGRKIKERCYGPVFEATNKQTVQKVAIKRVRLSNEETLKRCKNSLEAYGLNISGTIKIIGYQKLEKEFIIFMELLQHNVSSLIFQYNKTNGNDYSILNPTIRSKIIFGVASIMKKMHKNKVINRDLNLQKVGLDQNLEPILLHCILAKVNKDHSNMSMMIYTKINVAPEMIYNENNQYSFPVDVYSFGVMLYQMFDNNYSIDNINLLSNITFLELITEGKRFDKSPKIPEHYWELINQCWRHDPNERPTFDEIVEILKNDRFALEEYGMKTNLDELHEYQNRIDDND